MINSADHRIVPLLLLLFTFRCGASTLPVETLLRDSGISRGVFLLIDHPDPDLAVGLASNGTILVQALFRDPEGIPAYRKALRDAGVYGGATAIPWAHTERLPFFNRFVDVVVVGEGSVVSPDEVERVLRPEGVAFRMENGRWTPWTKPSDPRLDQWTHWFGNAGNNPNNQDQVVGAIQGVQWHIPQDPLNHQAQFYGGGVAVAGGLYGRSAYNGVRFWHHPEGRDVGIGRGERTITSICLDENAAYGVLTEAGPMQRIDLQTGEITRLTQGLESPATVERARVDHLVPIVARHRHALLQAFQSDVVALNPDTGERLWRFRHSDADKKAMLMAADGDRVYVGFGVDPLKERMHYRQVIAPVTEIVGLDLHTGKPVWSFHDFDTSKRLYSLLAYQDHLYLGLLADKMVLDTLIKLDGRQGTVVRSRQFDAARDLEGTHWHQYLRIWRDQIVITTNGDVFLLNLDLEDAGKAYDHPDRTPGYGHCTFYRGTASGQNAGQQGWLSFTDQTWYESYITRSVCDHGPAPAYGMLFPVNPGCGCYVRLDGHVALRCDPDPDPTDVPDHLRLTRGVPFQPPPPPARYPADEEWPMYLRDATRSNATPAPLGTQLDPLFELHLPVFDTGPVGADQRGNVDTLGRIGAPVVADGLLFVAATDAHRLYAFDARTGAETWVFDTGGRIDVAPVIYRGLCLFGSRDGYVYALRARDGALVWKFLAAPRHRQIHVAGQIQSAWPVQGGVTVFDDAIYAVAGIISGSDAGLYLYRLSLSGDLLARQRIHESIDSTANPAHRATQKFFGRYTTEMNDVLVANVDQSLLFLGKIAIHPKTLVWTSLYGYPRTEPIFPGDPDLRMCVEDPGTVSFTRSSLRASIGRVDGNQHFYACATANIRFMVNAVFRKEEPRAIAFAQWPMRLGRALLASPGGRGQIRRFDLDQHGEPVDPLAKNDFLPARDADGGLVVGNYDDRGWGQVTGNEEILFMSGFTQGRVGNVLIGDNLKQIQVGQSPRKLNEIRLPAPGVRNGMAIAYGNLYITLNDGTVLAYNTRP